MNEKLELIENVVAYIENEGPYSIYHQKIFKDDIRVIPTENTLMFLIVDIARISGYARSNLWRLIKRKNRLFEGHSVTVTVTGFDITKKDYISVDEEGISMLFMSMNLDRIKDSWRRDMIFEFQKWAHRLVAGVFFKRVKVEDPENYLIPFPQHINDIHQLYRLREMHPDSKGEFMRAYCLDNDCCLATAYTRLRRFKQGKKYFDWGKNKGKMISITPMVEKKLRRIIRKHPRASVLKIQKLLNMPHPSYNTIRKWVRINRPLIIPDNEHAEMYKGF